MKYFSTCIYHQILAFLELLKSLYWVVGTTTLVDKIRKHLLGLIY